MNFDLRSRTIFLAVSGSRAYGTSTPASDWDLRGIAVAPIGHYTGFLHTFEQYQGKLGWAEIPETARSETDVQIYDIKKFCALAVDANPNVLELLFLPEDCWIVRSPWMDRILEHRKLFLSRKVRHTFAGYAHSQLKRIKTHRRWLMDPPTHKPTRSEFGLPERPPISSDQSQAAIALVERQTKDWEFHPDEEIPITVLERSRERTREMLATVLAANFQVNAPPELESTLFRAAGFKLGLDSNFLNLLDAEKRYQSALQNYHSYEEWKIKRNPARAELEAKHGFDTKHGAHLVRLLRCCEELLTTGEFHVRRPDSEELRAIRSGAWTYDQMIEFATETDRKMDALYYDPKGPLPYKPDRVAVDALCSEIIQTFTP